MKKKIFIALLLVSLCASSAFADLVPFSFSKLKSAPPKNLVRISENETLPESYDLRTFGHVPPIKNQSPYGTCWIFGTLSAVETGYLHQHLGKSDFIDGVTKAEDMKLSEAYIVWFGRMNADRKYNFTVTDEKWNIIRDPKNTDAFRGGSIGEAVAIMTRGWGWGPVEDKYLPYKNFAKDDPSKEIAELMTHSHDDYPTVLRPTEIVFSSRYSQDVMFQKENRDQLKKLLMDYGGLAIS